MKKLATLLSLLLLLLITKVSAQEKIADEGTKMEVEIVKNGKIERGVGYFIIFDMKDLKVPYTAIVIDKHFIENTKQATLHFPKQRRYPSKEHPSKCEVEDISKYLFTDQSNSLAIIRFGELSNHLEDQIISSTAVFIPDDSISGFSIPLDEIKLKALKESWEKSMLSK